jgi:MFS family permease
MARCLLHGEGMTSDASSSAPAPIESPLRVPIFRAMWVATLVSNFGSLIQSVGAAWMMTSLTGSPRMVALVQSSTVLPFMLLSLFAGAVADNLDRRRILLATQGFMLAMSGLLSLCAWQGWLSPWLLLAFTFLIGCGTAMNAPAWQASVGDLVRRDQISRAVGLNSMAFNLARTVGPAIGGAIVAAAGAAAAFTLNTLTYFPLIGVLFRWRHEEAERKLPPEGLLHAMGAGLRYVSMSPNLRIVVVRATAFGVSANAISALMPLVARNLMAGGALTYGLLLGAFGIGAVLGGLASSRLRSRYSTETIIRGASLVLAAGTATTAFSPFLPLTLLALTAAGASWVLALSTFNITIQLASPRWVVARALSVYQMTAFGGMAVGAWLLGWVAEHHGVSTGLLVGAVAQTCVVLIGLAVKLPQVDDLNLDPLTQWREPEVAVQIEPRSGPIVVTIEYRILESNIRPFLAAMTERRRIRRRDGAMGWTLLRDLNATELWVERYHVATWQDYIRHNQRRTQADAENSATLRALLKDDTRLVVHRMIERQTGSLPDARRSEPVMTDAMMSGTPGAA